MKYSNGQLRLLRDSDLFAAMQIIRKTVLNLGYPIILFTKYCQLSFHAGWFSSSVWAQKELDIFQVHIFGKKFPSLTKYLVAAFVPSWSLASVIARAEAAGHRQSVQHGEHARSLSEQHRTCDGAAGYCHPSKTGTWLCLLQQLISAPRLL